MVIYYLIACELGSDRRQPGDLPGHGRHHRGGNSGLHQGARNLHPEDKIAAAQRWGPVLIAFTAGSFGKEGVCPCLLPGFVAEPEVESDPHGGRFGKIPVQVVVEHRHGKVDVPVRGAVDHALADDAGAAWSKALQ